MEQQPKQQRSIEPLSLSMASSDSGSPLSAMGGGVRKTGGSGGSSLAARLVAWVAQADPHKVLGLGFICLVAVIWVAASFLVQEIVGMGLKPLVLTYIANSLFAVLLPVWWVQQRVAARRRARSREYERMTTDDEEGAGLVGGRGGETYEEEASGLLQQQQQVQRSGEEAPYTVGQTFRAALMVAPLWFSAQLTFNLSLGCTSVTSNTILSSTSSLFTFALSVALLGERFTLPKLLSIALCMAGTAMVTIGDSNSSGGASGASSEGGSGNGGGASEADAAAEAAAAAADNAWCRGVVGDALALLSAAAYAVYTLAIRLRLPDDDKVSMSLFFGLIGAVNLVAAAPLLIGAQLLSVIDLASLSAHAVGLTVVKGLFDNVLSDYLWARAVLLIGPTVATVGLSMQVPIAIAADVAFKSPAWLAHGVLPAVLVLGGGCLVLAGFFGVNLASAGEPPPHVEPGAASSPRAAAASSSSPSAAAAAAASDE